MNIKEAKEEIKNTLRAYHRKDEQGRYSYPLIRQRPILLMGPPGIGKTAIMEQIARECGVGLVSYTITHHTRQSAIGLPRIMSRNYGGQEMSVTEYTLSEIIAAVYDCMERTGKKEGILFIDEINCASETLAPVMLQFLQNKTFGSHRVPEGCMIVAAGNPAEYNKSVREFDIVTLDRVRRMDITADCGVWMEYAWERKIHGAVLSYLNLKPDHFYVMKNRGEEKQFVTARGWEDLSELLKNYEELGVGISADLMQQFLQHPGTARDFYSYYQLYRKYGTDYGVEEILSGTLTEEEYKERQEMAKKAGFDERFTVTGLLVDGLSSGLTEFEAMDRRVSLLHERLVQLKAVLDTREDMQVLQQFIQDKTKSLEVKVEKELIGSGEASLEQDVLFSLEEYDLVLKKEHILDKTEGFERLKDLFEEEVRERKRLLERLQESMEQVFRFTALSFGEDQEMILLLSCLMRNPVAMIFISEHGCPSFFRYSGVLMQEKTDRELQENCRKLLKISGEGEKIG